MDRDADAEIVNYCNNKYASYVWRFRLESNSVNQCTKLCCVGESKLICLSYCLSVYFTLAQKKLK